MLPRYSHKQHTKRTNHLTTELCSDFQVQEHGVGNGAVKRRNGQDEGTEGNEKIGSGGNAQ